jgi:uncharacterized repeat protein (TIGR01451 family)
MQHSRYPLVRSIVPVLAPLAALGFTAGCSTSGGTSPSANAQRSVETSNVTREPAARDDARFSLAYPTGDRRTSALLVEQISPNEVRLNREAPTQLRITNLTNQPLRGIAIRPEASEGLRLVAATQPAGATANTGITANTNAAAPTDAYQVGDLGPRESRTINLTAVPQRVGKLDACYAVTVAPQMLCTTLNVVNPMLRVTAQAPADADVCQDIVYRYNVANTGTGTARAVVLESNLPDGLTTADGARSIRADLGDIPQGEAREVTAHLKAQRTAKFTTQAVVRSRDETVQVEPLATATHAPALAVAVKGPDREYVGKSVAYQVTVTNTGDAPASQAALRFGTSDVGRVVAVNPINGQQPREAQLASAGSAASGQELGTIAPGESRQVQVVTTSNAGGVLSLNVDATAACASPARQVVQTQILTVPALLLQAVDESDPVRVGDNVVYDVTVLNQGSGPDSNVRVTATLPPNVEFVGVTGATDGQINGRTITFAPVPRLAPKESANWKVTARVLRPGDVQFRASAVSDSVKTPAEKVEPTRLY